MWLSRIVSSACLSGLSLWLGAASIEAQSNLVGSSDTKARAVRRSDAKSIKIFDNCSSCHAAPLLELATDRAWLDGIKQTA